MSLVYFVYTLGLDSSSKLSCKSNSRTDGISSLCRIDISRIDFKGGVVATLLDVFERAIRGVLERKIAEFICTYMSNLRDLGVELLGNLTAFVDPFLSPIVEIDPLAPEVAFNRTADSKLPLVSFQKPEGFLPVAVVTLLDEGTKMLGGQRNSPTGLAINTIIEDYLLDNNRTLVIEPTALGLLNDGYLVDAALGNFSEIQIRVDGFRVQGLDTFSRFDSLEFIGAFTLQGSFALEYLILEVDVYIALGPLGSDKKVEEMVSVSITAEDLELSFAVLAAINSESLGALEIGNLLQLAAIIPCLFSTAESLSITSLNTTIGAIADPFIKEFQSPGLARVTTAAMEGFYELFDDVFVASIPGMFATSVKDLLNAKIASMMDGSGCVKLVPPTGTPNVVDFRDMFYRPAEAKSMGGSGTQPYGVLTPLVRDLVDQFLVDDNPMSGMPMINEELIVPLTNYLSDAAGELKFNGTLLSMTGTLNIGDFKAASVFTVYDARIHNLDTITSPLTLLVPSNSSGHELDNKVTFGYEDRPMHASVRILVSVKGESKLQANLDSINRRYENVH